MTFLKHLKRSDFSSDLRWIVKYNKNGSIKEVKQIYKPSEYYAQNRHKGENARPLHNKNALIKILENAKSRRNQKMGKI